MEEKKLFKDVFNAELVKQMAINITEVYPGFDGKNFESSIVPKLAPKSLTERSHFIKEALYEFLPKNYPEAIKIIINSFDGELVSSELTGLAGFYYMPFGNYISSYGLSEEHYEISMNALYELTKRFTSEGPIRPFIRKFQEKTMAILHEWSKDENVHVRRLVSEGTRPKLPWASPLREFQKDPKPVIELLEKLKEDSELYVRRSVANNLNDIAKDHPELVVSVLEEWSQIGNQETKWIVSHAARTLLKQGNSKALSLLGFPQDISIKIENLRTDQSSIRMGEEISFSFDLKSESVSPQNLMIDFIVHYMKANGKQAPKVFKLSKKELAAKETISITKKISFKPITRL